MHTCLPLLQCCTSDPSNALLIHMLTFATIYFDTILCHTLFSPTICMYYMHVLYNCTVKKHFIIYTYSNARLNDKTISNTYGRHSSMSMRLLRTPLQSMYASTTPKILLEVSISNAINVPVSDYCSHKLYSHWIVTARSMVAFSSSNTNRCRPSSKKNRNTGFPLQKAFVGLPSTPATSTIPSGGDLYPWGGGGGKKCKGHKHLLNQQTETNIEYHH